MNRIRIAVIVATCFGVFPLILGARLSLLATLGLIAAVVVVVELAFALADERNA